MIILKKLLCVILTLALILSAASVGVFAAADKGDVRFGVASDLHYCPPRQTFEKTNDDPIFWYANRRAAMEDEGGFIIDEFLNRCEEEDYDFVLISGDLADDGKVRPEDHRAVAEKLRSFEKRTGKQVYVINGNHDVGMDSATTRATFMEIYHDFGFDEALCRDDKTCSYTADLNAKYRLIALDSNDPSKSTEDGMTLDLVRWVVDQAKQAKEDGKYPILMMHHNLIDHMPIQRLINRNFIVRYHFTTAELFADAGIKLVLTGHEHCNDTAVYTSALGNKIYDFTTTSLTMYPLAYREFTLTEDKIDYSLNEIEKIDYDALRAACPEFTDAQIELMKTDLNAYAKQFLKVGVQYRLQLSWTDEKLGVKKGDFGYSLVRGAVDILNNTLSDPLYGEGSVSERALKYGIEIPQTGYKNGWDLATDIVAAHYAGEETLTIDSPEVTALFRTFAVLFREEAAGIDNAVLDDAAGGIFKNLGVTGISDRLVIDFCKSIGTYTAAEYLLLAIASPILAEFVSDSDGASDNNGSIEGYGAGSVTGNIANVGKNSAGIAGKIGYYISLVLRYILKIAAKYVA